MQLDWLSFQFTLLILTHLMCFCMNFIIIFVSMIKILILYLKKSIPKTKLFTSTKNSLALRKTNWLREKEISENYSLFSSSFDPLGSLMQNKLKKNAILLICFFIKYVLLIFSFPFFYLPLIFLYEVVFTRISLHFIEIKILLIKKGYCLF